ncbi:hypothetical protein STURON_00157 [Spiroplasma turonicum]|uniref:Septation ring formation regulator n=2 Tax=Spiroplasma turonicum TaxID=216946 RepID=A0A0K1P544_9MOLU|nr:hypothetical protein STURON_00157 [Spiroplasma turonicum]
MQTIAKAVDLIDDIKKSPLKYRIERVSKIYDKTGNLETEFMVWRTKYEILYEKEFLNIITDFHKKLMEKASTRPSFKNIQSYKEFYNRLINVNKNIHTIYIEIMNVLEVEFIQRDALTFQKELFRVLKEEVIMASYTGVDINEKKLSNTLDSIEELFKNFYENLDVGKYKESWESLLKIDQALIFMIELLDSIPYIISTIQNAVPKQLIELKNKYVTFGAKNKKLKFNATKYSNLEETIDKLRIKIKEELLKLQYKKAYKWLNDIFENIESFKEMLEEEDTIKTFFENKIDNIRNIYLSLSDSIFTMYKKFMEYEIGSKYQSEEKILFEKTKQNFLYNKSEAEKIIADVDIAINRGTSLDFPNLKSKLQNVLKETLKDIEDIEKAAKLLNKKSINVDSILNQVIFIKSCLNQCNVKIKQYKSIIELSKFIEPIDELLISISKFSPNIIQKVTSVEQRLVINSQVDDLLKQATELITNLNDTIFLDFISQEIIIYLERYVGIINDIDKVIYNCESYFKNRNLEQLIGYSLDVLGKIKKAKLSQKGK